MNFNNIKKYIKICLFFALNFLFLIVFFIYQVFYAIYKNTQIHFKYIMISFGLSLLYQIGLCLIPGIFRYPSLRESKQDKECLYKFIQIIESII